eukprot:scaffold70935_cov30-Phaeocystis_antarctica.AAC.1
MCLNCARTRKSAESRPDGPAPTMATLAVLSHGLKAGAAVRECRVVLALDVQQIPRQALVQACRRKAVEVRRVEYGWYLLRHRVREPRGRVLDERVEELTLQVRLACKLTLRGEWVRVGG